MFHLPSFIQKLVKIVQALTFLFFEYVCMKKIQNKFKKEDIVSFVWLLQADCFFKILFYYHYQDINAKYSLFMIKFQSDNLTIIFSEFFFSQLHFYLQDLNSKVCLKDSNSILLGKHVGTYLLY